MALISYLHTKMEPIYWKIESIAVVVALIAGFLGLWVSTGFAKAVTFATILLWLLTLYYYFF